VPEVDSVTDGSVDNIILNGSSEICMVDPVYAITRC
jgi:hypothetical protein